jgi:hypothetical protein
MRRPKATYAGVMDPALDPYAETSDTSQLPS